MSLAHIFVAAGISVFCEPSLFYGSVEMNMMCLLCIARCLFMRDKRWGTEPRKFNLWRFNSPQLVAVTVILAKARIQWFQLLDTGLRRCDV